MYVESTPSPTAKTFNRLALIFLILGFVITALFMTGAAIYSIYYALSAGPGNSMGYMVGLVPVAISAMVTGVILLTTFAFFGAFRLLGWLAQRRDETIVVDQDAYMTL